MRSATGQPLRETNFPSLQETQGGSRGVAAPGFQPATPWPPATKAVVVNSLRVYAPRPVPPQACWPLTHLTSFVNCVAAPAPSRPPEAGSLGSFIRVHRGTGHDTCSIPPSQSALHDILQLGPAPGAGPSA